MTAPNCTAKQLLAVESLASGATYAKTAMAVGISKRQLVTWAKLLQFKAALSEAKLQRFALSCNRLQASAGDMVKVLTDLASDEKTTPSVRVRAAMGVLELNLKSTELESIVGKLDEIQSQITEVKQLQEEDRQPKSEGRTFRTGWSTDDDDTTEDQEAEE